MALGLCTAAPQASSASARRCGRAAERDAAVRQRQRQPRSSTSRCRRRSPTRRPRARSMRRCGRSRASSTPGCFSELRNACWSAHPDGRVDTRWRVSTQSHRHGEPTESAQRRRHGLDGDGLPASHHGFRRDIRLFAGAVGARSRGTLRSWPRCARSGKRFRETLHGHHTVEDTAMFPGIEGAASRAGRDHRRTGRRPPQDRSDAGGGGPGVRGACRAAASRGQGHRRAGRLAAFAPGDRGDAHRPVPARGEGVSRRRPARPSWRCTRRALPGAPTASRPTSSRSSTSC